jgi:hypothetical protein
VDVAALWHAPSIGSVGRQHVPLHDRDIVIEVSQYTCGDQAAHARPEYDRVFPQFFHTITMSPLVRAT